MTQITPQIIDQIALLARLKLTEAEKEMYAAQIGGVLGYIEMLNEVDTKNVPETCQVTGLEDVFRADEPVATDLETKKKLIACFPEKIGTILKVKGVFTE